MSSKYVDNNAIINVLGTLFNYPNIIEQEDKYYFDVEDYVSSFHKLIFSSIYNLKLNGLHKMSVVDIEMYLEKTPSLYAIYERNKGTAFLESVSEIIDIDKFDYYFNRMKKFTLLRNLDKCGVNVKKFYDPDEILDQKKINSQNTWLELTSVEEMANEISDNIQKVIDDSVASTLSVNCQAGDGVRELINRFKQAPEVGIPMYGDMMNTIFRGCRLKKFYLRSAPSGQGKVIAV